MAIELRITSGSRAGQRERLEKSVITIGRHPACDFRFHPEKDPDVSAKHAEMRVLETRATIHDLGSTNGTFVNGQRVDGERALFEGDLIAFGLNGPKVEFHRVASGEVAPPPPTAVARASGPTPPDTNPSPAARNTPRRDTTARIAEAVEHETGKLRQMVLGLGALVIVGVGGAWWMGHRDSTKAQAQVNALLHRNDSLSAALEKTIGSMGGRVAGLDSALQASKSAEEQLKQRIRSEMSKGASANVGDLTSQLDAQTVRQRALAGAAQVDYQAIAEKNHKAIVFIAVEFSNGTVVSGSGFNIAPNGMVVTNRHVVQDEQGQPAKRVSVIFDGTKGAWKKSRVVKVSQTDELAFIKIEEGGGYPTVQIAKGAPAVGAPLAIIGYPLGTSTAGMGGDINTLQPSSTLGVGTVAKALPDTLQLDAYAAQGSSGSAVFDATGNVVGVVFGGPREAAGRIVYAVPAAKLVAQMP